MLGVSTVREALDQAEQILKSSGAIDHPHAGKERVDAEEILSFVIGNLLGLLPPQYTPADDS